MKNTDTAGQFQERLVSELNRRGIQYKTFAKRIGISLSSLNTYIYRGSMPSADVAVRMAKELGVSAEYLVSGDGKPHRSKSGVPEISETPAREKLLQLLDGLSDGEVEGVLKIVEGLLALRG